MSSAHVLKGDAQFPSPEEGIPRPPKAPLKAAEKKLADLGYYFNDALQMRQVANDEPFEFRTQAHYEELGDSVAHYIQELMVAEYGMRRWVLPVGRDTGVRVLEGDEEDEGPGVPIFVSENAKEAKALLVLVCGSGAVMAGQWARKLCMNDSLHQGSVIPLLVWAAQHGIGTVVLNPNFRLRGGARMNAEKHVVQAWDQVIAKLPAEHVAMVAHSYGGVCACRLLSERENEVLSRLRCIAFTDSVHGTWGPDILRSAAKRFFARHCVNWAQSEAPLDTVMDEAFLPAEDREAEAERELETEPETMSVYDEVLDEASGETKEKKTQSGEMEGAKSSNAERESDLGEAAIVVSEGKEVTAADVSAAAAGLGFSEAEAVNVSMEKKDVSMVEDSACKEKEDVSTGNDDVSMEEEAGGSRSDATSDQIGQIFDVRDTAGLAAAAEREKDPALKAMLQKFAGQAGGDDFTAGPSGSSADVSMAGGDVSRPPGARDGAGMMARGNGGRAGRGGRPARKAQKTGFSWDNLGRNKEHCRCSELSAGVDEHERTTYSALKSVKRFLEKKLTAAGAELRSAGEAVGGGAVESE